MPSAWLIQFCFRQACMFKLKIQVNVYNTTVLVFMGLAHDEAER